MENDDGSGEGSRVESKAFTEWREEFAIWSQRYAHYQQVVRDTHKAVAECYNRLLAMDLPTPSPPSPPPPEFDPPLPDEAN